MRVIEAKVSRELYGVEVSDRVLSVALTQLVKLWDLAKPSCLFVSDLVELIESNKRLFVDVPSQTHLFKHDIGVIPRAVNSHYSSFKIYLVQQISFI